jgi:hypothetical protein
LKAATLNIPKALVNIIKLSAASSLAAIYVYICIYMIYTHTLLFAYFFVVL